MYPRSLQYLLNAIFDYVVATIKEDYKLTNQHANMSKRCC